MLKDRLRTYAWCKREQIEMIFYYSQLNIGIHWLIQERTRYCTVRTVARYDDVVTFGDNRGKIEWSTTHPYLITIPILNKTLQEKKTLKPELKLPIPLFHHLLSTSSCQTNSSHCLSKPISNQIPFLRQPIELFSGMVGRAVFGDVARWEAANGYSI